MQNVADDGDGQRRKILFVMPDRIHVEQALRRVGVAARLGFELAVVPFGNRDPNSRMPRMHGLKVVEAATVAEALAALGLHAKRRAK